MSAVPYDEPPTIGQLPPHSNEAEQSVLGGLLLDNSAWDRIVDLISEADFYSGQHRLIFRTIVKLLAKSSTADILTVDEALKNAGDAEDAGGLAYLGRLAQSTPSAHNIRRYAEIVRERAIMRRLVVVGTEIADSGLHPRGRPVGDLLDEAEAKVLHIAEEGTRRDGALKLGPLLAQAMGIIDERYQNPNKLMGLATGYHDLDAETSGLQGGDLIIIAGRPSMGKTALALNIAEHVAINDGQPVAVFSMEMPGLQLAFRLLGSVGRIDQTRLKTGRLIDHEWERLTRAIDKMHEAPLDIDETGALSAIDLRSRARRMHRQWGRLGLIVVDYLQLMQPGGGRGENRATEISEISRALKALAKELSVPVIALSQLNRGLEQRPNKRPIMSDLRESGAIEQDADLILFIYRDEVYNPESAERGKAEIIIAKQRNGPIGTVNLTWLGHHTRFENYARVGAG